MKERSLSRRSFLKASALGTAATAMGVALSDSLVEADPAYAESADETKRIRTCCHGCIQVCPVIVYLTNGVVTKIEGDPAAPVSKGGVCMKCLNQLHTVYSPRRILHPLKRAGERGENKWEQVSWDEAVEYAADEFKKLIDKYGNYSIMATTGGGGGYEFFQTVSLAMAFKSPNSFEPGCAQCYVPRMAMAEFMYGGPDQSMADSTNNEALNQVSNATEAIVLWGTQPSVSQVAQAGRAMADLRARGAKTVVIDPNFSPDAAKATVHLPVRPGSDTAMLLCWFRYIFENKLYDEEFTKYWTNLPFLIDPDTKLPVRAEEIWPDYVNPVVDPDGVADTPAYVCLDERTGKPQPFPYSAPADSLVDPTVFAEVELNGKSYKTAGQIYKEAADPWTLEKTEEICWVPKERIEEAIHVYADASVAGIANGVFGDQQPIASQVTKGCLGLDMIMGYVNKPGSCLTKTMDKFAAIKDMLAPGKRPVSPSCTVTGAVGMTMGIGATVGYTEEANRQAYEAYENKEMQALSKNLLMDRLGMANHEGLFYIGMSHIPTVHKAIDTGEPYKIAGWFDQSGNKFAQLGDAGSWYDSLPNMEFIAGQYANLTSFHVEACDVVFPTEEWLEYEGTDRMAQLNYTFLRVGVIHLGETVAPDVPARKVLERMAEKYPGSVIPDLYQGVGTQQAARDAQAEKFGVSWDELMDDQDKYIPSVIPDEEYWQYDQHLQIVNDGLPAGFATESRKCEVYASMLLKMSRNGYPFTYPFEMPPAENGDYSPVVVYIEPAESPLTDTEYPIAITSGRLPHFHHGTMRHAAFARELMPTAEIKINPRTAAELGIQHMDWVKVTSRRASTNARAYLTEGVAPNVAWMERFWNPECFDESIPEEKRTGGWREENINVLTKATDEFDECFGSYTLRGFTVKIEKGERPDNVWVEPEEFRPFMPTLHNEPQTGDVF